MSGAGVSCVQKSSRIKTSTDGTAQAREAVFPTRQALGQIKSKLKGAQTGHDLLKRKSEALTKYGPSIFVPKP